MNDRIAISLGWDCRPTEYGIEHGLRPIKEDGYNTCPFDLMGSNPEGVIACIRDDFKDFCNSDYLYIEDRGESEKIHTRYFIWNKKYRFAFNHESPHHAYLYRHQGWGSPDYFVDNDFFHFRKRYERRIENFREYCREGFVSFIIQFPSQSEVLQIADEHKDDGMNLFGRETAHDQAPLLKELNDALTTRYPELDYDIKILSPEQVVNYEDSK